LRKKIFLFLISLTIAVNTFSISFQIDGSIKWDSIQKVEINESNSIDRLSFAGGHYNKFKPVPYYSKVIPIYSSDVVLSAILSNITVEITSPKETKLLKNYGFADTAFSVRAYPVIARKEPLAQVEIVPVRWNNNLNIYEKLISFKIRLEIKEKPQQQLKDKQLVENSVLASGDWYKVRVSKSGIYKITYQELSNMGFNVGADPRKIAIFGNGGGILPEKNDVFTYDDLQQNPILVSGESDGSFDPTDYIIFYGEGPVLWKYNSFTQTFYHQNNYYDDYSYYFITVLSGEGKRISEINVSEDNYDTLVNEFTDYAFHEVDELNLAGTGKVWYGEQFDLNSSREFDFDFPNIATKKSAYLKADFAAIAETPSQFEIYINDNLEKTLSMPVVSATDTYQIGDDRATDFVFGPESDHVIIKLKYVRSSNSSSAYLNYIDLNVKRLLKMTGSQMSFRQPIQTGQIAKYVLDGANDNVKIWDVTEAINPRKVKANSVSGKLEFFGSTDKIREYIAFDGTSYNSTEFVEKVSNQNLHNVKNIEYLIIAHPDFLAQAKKLADYHRSKGMTVYVTTPDLIYNEFSSGSQDITAIRNFAKYLYDNSDPGKEIKYLLLFGDASYDYKDRISDNTNYVPCWESIESLNIVWSVASDDYFGFLDDGEGDPNTDKDRVDIGIGRFVVANEDQANMAVEKSIHYDQDNDAVMGPWRTSITFVADDGDSNTHMKHAEYLSDSIQEKHKIYNINKIYLDAYHQISTPAGQKAPDVNNAINQRIEKGTLIFNYSGHGGEIGLGHEQILTITDINSWDNYDELPVFITATCEFSRYEDPTRVSAGELVFLNPKGGAIALFSTARATFAASNLSLNRAIYENNIFTKQGGQYPRFGDVIRKSKKSSGDNDKKFVLLGDPALRLAYPDLGARTTFINQNAVVENEYDTIHALEKVSVSGIVVDENGNKVDSFNGTLFPTVYDKYSKIVTLGDENPQKTFLLRQNILFNGKASIENGEFMFEFIVPKDIAYNYGQGRISYYLKNDSVDGAGYYEGIVIGGFDENALTDNQGPDIQLFMNDTTFKSGDITDQNPILLAKLFDESGINTTGNGIGHDILATIDNEKSQSYAVNSYYEADRDSYNSGTVRYPFRNLENGMHTLSFKIWDIYNNSSIAYLQFLVTTKEDLIVQNLINYPNPFTEGTNFVFDHNQSGKQLDVKILIYNSTGALIKSIQKNITPEGYKSTPIYWDGTTDGGGKIGRGFYVYRTIVKNPEGATAYDDSKLVYIR